MQHIRMECQENPGPCIRSSRFASRHPPPSGGSSRSLPLFCSADRFPLQNSVETIIFGGAGAGAGKGRKDDMSILPTRNTPCNTNSGCNLQVPKQSAGLAVICLLCPGSGVMSEIKRVPPCRDQCFFPYPSLKDLRTLFGKTDLCPIFSLNPPVRHMPPVP